jgi:hypothetical protein
MGEGQVLSRLLDIGAAVNGLTMDDSGWDVHLHLPVEPMASASSRAKSDSWELSGRAAHIQVKARSTLRKVVVDSGTARGWCTGSAYGTPTFIILVPALDSGKFGSRFLDPFAIQESVGDGSSATSLPFSDAPAFRVESFGYLADLWSRHGAIMLSLGESARQYAYAASESVYESSLIEIVILLGRTALVATESRADGDSGDVMRSIESIVAQLLSKLDYAHIINDSKAQSIHLELSGGMTDYHGEWMDPEIPLAAISPSRDAGTFMNDLEEFAGRLGTTSRVHRASA